jgi:hypothetical protein
MIKQRIVTTKKIKTVDNMVSFDVLVELREADVTKQEAGEEGGLFGVGDPEDGALGAGGHVVAAHGEAVADV